MSRQHCDQAIELYDPVEHRQLATRFAQDVRVTSLLYRSWALWVLGYPESSLVDAEEAVADAREIGQDATLIYSLLYASWTDLNCGKYLTAETRLDEAVALAIQRGVFYWNAVGTMHRGWFSAVTGKHSEAVSAISSGIRAWRATGATLWSPFFLSCLAMAHSQLHQPREAWRHIGEAMATMRETKESVARQSKS